MLVQPPSAASTANKSGPIGHNSKLPAPTLDQLLAWYESMILIRRFEEKAGQLYGMGLIGGFCHLSIGQEAVAVGIQSVLNKTDSVVTAYRARGQIFACGMDPKAIMAELTGRAGGCSKGKGGSMHMFSREKKFYGGHGIVGAQIPIGAGLAFAHKYNNDGGLSVAYMGDGAANQGQVYEALNMASLWKLPCLFIIENNHYAMGTSLHRSVAGELYRRGDGFCVPGKRVDGMDFMAVREAAAEATAYIREGNGPMLLEIHTYRYRGHSMSDPGKYRSKEEVEKYKTERDALDRMRGYVVAAGGKEEQIKAIEQKIKKIVADAVDFATTCPEPDASELWTDVLIEESK